MRSFLKSLFAATALLAIISPSLRAQSAGSDLSLANATAADIVAVNGVVAPISNGTLALGSFTFPHIVRKYTGTATQTTAAGVTTSGTFTLNVESDGSLNSTFTFGGVGSGYYGAVARTSLGEQRLNGSGYLQQLTVIDVGANPDGTPAQVVTTAQGFRPIKIPVALDSGSITGGILNADGSSLLFRGDRVVK